MQCPQCNSSSVVKETRTPVDFQHTFLLHLSREWPELVCRRRRCKACQHTWPTVELPVDDLQLLLADVARQATQMMAAI